MRAELPQPCLQERALPTNRTKLRALLALAGYLGLVAWLSHQAHPPVPRPLQRLSDKVLHAAEYAPVGYLWAVLLAPKGPLAALAAAGACGLADEVHQAFVPGRDASALDLAADLAGAALGIAAHRALRRRKNGGLHR